MWKKEKKKEKKKNEKKTKKQNKTKRKTKKNNIFRARLHCTYRTTINFTGSLKVDEFIACATFPGFPYTIEL